LDNGIGYGSGSNMMASGFACGARFSGAAFGGQMDRDRAASLRTGGRPARAASKAIGAAFFSQY
jgi:hypothetical protein